MASLEGGEALGLPTATETGFTALVCFIVGEGLGAIEGVDLLVVVGVRSFCALLFVFEGAVTVCDVPLLDVGMGEGVVVLLGGTWRNNSNFLKK